MALYRPGHFNGLAADLQKNKSMLRRRERAVFVVLCWIGWMVVIDRIDDVGSKEWVDKDHINDTKGSDF